jgi:hypothetical protein
MYSLQFHSSALDVEEVHSSKTLVCVFELHGIISMKALVFKLLNHLVHVCYIQNLSPLLAIVGLVFDVELLSDFLSPECIIGRQGHCTFIVIPWHQSI